MDKPVPACSFFLLLLIFSLSSPVLLAHYSREQVEEALSIVNDIASDNMGPVCVSQAFRMLPTPVETDRYDVIRQKADMAALLLEQVGVTHHSGVAQAVSRSLVASDPEVVESRVVGVNATTGLVESSAVWRKVRESRGPRLDEHVSDMPPLGVQEYSPPGDPHPAPAELPPGIELPPEVPWYPEGGQFAPHVAPAARGLWTYPYYSCQAKSWLLSYTVTIPNSSNQLLKGFLSFDIDISRLEINQCDASQNPRQIKAFLGSHKCHNTTQCMFHREEMNWRRGSYSCECRDGYYLSKAHSVAFDGSIMEIAWGENGANGTTPWVETPFHCLACAPGCLTCTDSTPCLATYNWPFRLTLLTVSAVCVFLTLCMIAFVFHHRRLKVFKVASPIFLSITLLGCAIMYLEMAAIFPILDIYSCIATKWSRHLGFCITYTALLMKTWRVSLTYRVKSAHKVKLTDKQLLQWMFPILLVMLIYLGTWTLSDPPHGEPIKDNNALIFKQCSFNWWDHSLAIGEVLFLAWGIRVCYSVRHAESLFNEARLISYAIYNIAIVNIAMVAFHLFLFPRAGPDIKYMLGFIRTQLSTSVTIALVFGPKVVRVIRGQGDQWDTKARTRAVTASFSLNGVGLVTEHTPDLYQENEELKEEIQKLAGQIEFMKIVNMELNNRHLKPRAGGYFSSGVPVQSPRTTAGAGPSTEVSERV